MVLNEVTSQEALPLKFCFFIDGLDEYTDGAKRYRGNFDELIQLIMSLTSSLSIKICVSSRPWPAFEKVFGSSRFQLRLEDLTQNDIKNYVEEELGSHPEFRRMSEEDARCATIAPTIVKRAQGVFHWVFLVVTKIRQGLSNYDTYRILESRLNSLPDDLNDYFTHMLTSIEPTYWAETLRIFRVMMSAAQALPLLSFDFISQEMEDPDYAAKMGTEPFELESLEVKYSRAKQRVMARGHDLLHVFPCSDAWEQMIRLGSTFSTAPSETSSSRQTHWTASVRKSPTWRARTPLIHISPYAAYTWLSASRSHF